MQHAHVLRPIYYPNIDNNGTSYLPASGQVKSLLATPSPTGRRCCGTFGRINNLGDVVRRVGWTGASLSGAGFIQERLPRAWELGRA